MVKKQIKAMVLMICISVIMLWTVDKTSAYFTTEEMAHNIITTAGIDIELIELSEKEDGSLVPFENVDGVMPGSEVSKIVQVKNIGEADAYVRISIEKQIILESNSAIGNVADEDLIKITYNDKDWIKLDDGYYYYNKVLTAGDTTEPIFESVILDTTMGNEYQNASIIIDVFVQATQVANNGNNVFEAAGWPAK